MREERLTENIIDQIMEAQIKLGFVREIIRLYFPWESLETLVGEERTDGFLEKLNCSPTFAGGKLGQVQFRESRGRVEVTIPPEGAEYVHREVPASPFLEALVGLFGTHHSLTIEEICQCFGQFGEYVCRKIADNDFDYVVYFKNPAVDAYYYCIKMEMGHTIYHRFIKEDYEKLMG